MSAPSEQPPHLTPYVLNAGRTRRDLTLTEAVKAGLEAARAEGYRAGIADAERVAQSHECGGDDDVICQGRNCAMVIAAHIRALASKEGDK